MNSEMLRVTNRIIERSRDTREAYLARINQAKTDTVHRAQLACGNLAHGFAACQADDKASLKSMLRNNIAIITSYNDMLSAHQPYERYPDIIRKALHSANAVGQVAGGVPAMCDGVTQGQDGMELSLLSREVIAMSAAVGAQEKSLPRMRMVTWRAYLVRKTASSAAAKPPLSVEAYEAFVAELRKTGLARVETGEFGADMKVTLTNDGPVTIVIDTDEWKR